MVTSDSMEFPLFASVRELIAKQGPLTFAEFMRLALYDPEHGYYRPTRSVVGTGGDFYTSVSATPMFGRLLVQVIGHHAAQLATPLPPVVHEFGAHRGQLRADILEAAPALAYHTYESHDAWPARLEGCVIANELLDALPFHRVQVVNGQWREVYVGLEGDELGWVTGELSNPELLEPLDGLPLAYMDGYTTEVSLGARRWLETLAARLERGLVFLFDYGHETEHYFAPHRKDGGLRTFYRHQRGEDPFAKVGEQDITCDVNFTDVVSTAQRVGFEVVDFTDQGRFFSRQVARVLRGQVPSNAGATAGSGETGSSGAAPHGSQTLQGGEAPFATAFTPEQVRGLMTLTHPAHMGLAFKVVVLRKGM